MTDERTHAEFKPDPGANVPEPLLPIERKLILYSFSLGVTLLALLTVLSHL